EKPNAAKGQVAKAPEVGSKPGADKDPVPVTDLGRKGAKQGKGALFRVSKDGRPDQLHALTHTYFTNIAIHVARAVFAGPPAQGGDGWSEWQGATAPGKLGGGSEGGKIASPAGRYLQFRVALEDDAARVRRVTSYYVPQNQPTTVQDVTVEVASKESLPTLK